MTTAVIFVFGMAIIADEAAAEKTKWHGTSLTIETKQIEVGDEEGHVMIITKSKQLYFNDAKHDDRRVGIAVNTMDINPKMKQMSLRGCGWNVDSDGDKIMRTHEGKPVGKGHWKGTWTYVKGTGKYDGIKGSGTWESFSIVQDQPSYLEILGDVEYPKQ